MGLSFKKHGVFCSSIIIDKLSVTISYKEKEERSHIVKRMAKLKNSDLFKHHGNRRWYQESHLLYAGDVQDRTWLVQAKPWLPSTPFLRLEYNPAHTDPVTLRVALQKLLPGGWADFMTRGICTRIDLAVDVSGIHVGELVCHWPGMRHSRLFFASGELLEGVYALPPLETHAIGKTGGARHVAIYDRVAKIKEANMKLIVKDPVPGVATTRIEFRLRPKIPTPEVIDLPNPFSKLKVQELALLPSESKDEKYRLFMQVCQDRGAQHALLMLDESTRKGFKKRLEQAASPWWEPSKIWEGLDAALANMLKPWPIASV